MTRDITFRSLTSSEVATALDWAAIEGWNPGLHDAEIFYQADPSGFYGAEIDGELVGTFSIVRYSDDFAFGGLYILNPKERGQGFGLQMQQHALDLARPLNLGIDGVFAMQERYRQVGFIYAYRNFRYAGTGGGSTPPGLVPIDQISFEEIAAYDTAHFPAPRPRFLKPFLSQQDATALASVDKDGIRGYGVIRQCRVGHKIGPLFADSAEVAEALFCGLAASVPGEEIFLDIPEPNSRAVDLASSHQMIQVFGTARMYTRFIPDLPLDEIFGVSTFELG
jgi:GNAT superfamily N-acetyltransferase